LQVAFAPEGGAKATFADPALECLGFLEYFFDTANHVERLLGDAVAFALDDHLETLDGVLERDVLARLNP
jgi:hypothetical protein